MNHFRFFAPDFEKPIKDAWFEFDERSVPNYRIVDADQPPPKRRRRLAARPGEEAVVRSSAVEPGFVGANGLRFAYLEQGKGPLVLLVHGFPDTAHTWDRTMPASSRRAGFRAVAPFTRGYYPTEIPSRRQVRHRDARRATLLALIEALGERAGDRRRSRLGRERGVRGRRARAPSACACSSRSRSRTRDRSSRRRRNVWKAAPLLRAAPRERRRRSCARTTSRYVDELWRRWSPAWKDMPASETAHVKEAFAQPGCLEAACAYYKQSRRGCRRRIRQRIKVPTVAFAGEHDMIAPRAFEKARHCFDGVVRGRAGARAATSCTASTPRTSSPSSSASLREVG